MSNPVLKPWSQVDDDLNETVVDETRSAPPHAEPASAAGSPAPRRGRFRPDARWALLPMALSAACLLSGILSLDGHPSGTPRPLLLAGLGLLLVAGLLLALARRTGDTDLSRVLSAVQRRPGGSAAVEPPKDPELAPIWRALREQVADIERQADESLEARRQLALELTLAETQRKQAVAILDALAQPVLATDAFGRLILVNRAAADLFAFTPAEKLRKPVEEALNDAPLLRNIHQALEADLRAAERRAEHVFNGRRYGSTILPLPDQNPRAEEETAPHGVVVLLRDITREHEAARKKSEFVAHVAHELRTPLSSIRAYVEMLVDGEAADEKTRREFYEILQASADRLGRLIDNMLNISRIEAGTVRINKEPMALSLVVKEAVDMMRPAAEEKKITLADHLTPVAYRALADRDLIYQAVINLISNAVKYTPEGGRIDVRMTPQDENRSMLIEVRDTGVGIPAEDLPRMFGKFFRVEAHKKIAKGTGLGLNLVKNIVEVVHDGQISLSSEVGKGSSFRIVLPLME